MNSKEQSRSRFALDSIENLTKNTGEVKEDLANFIVGTPTMILQNGLGQTMAFLLSKCKGAKDPKDKHYFTYQAIAKWCKRQNEKISDEPHDFFSGISQMPQNQYLMLQEEALKMLQWLKRYARAFQEVTDNEPAE
jgi:CRISPR-associated protein Cmr5